MEQQVKTIRIKEGNVLVSPMVEPIPSSDPNQDVSQYYSDMQSFEDSFVEVGNTLDLNFWWYPICGNSFTKLHDGDYPAPEGLTMSITKHGCRKQSCDFEGQCQAELEGLICKAKDVATVKFIPAEKEVLLDKLREKSEQLEKEHKSHIVNNTEQLNVSAAEKEEKPDCPKYAKVNCTSECVNGFCQWEKYDCKKLQQEITTLRARIAELEKKQ